MSINILHIIIIFQIYLLNMRFFLLISKWYNKYENNIWNNIKIFKYNNMQYQSDSKLKRSL